MATTNPPPRAPWRDLFQSHLAQMPRAEFSLATVSHDVASGKTYPRVRSCIFRGFWAELTLRGSAAEELQQQQQREGEEGSGGQAENTTDVSGQNPALYESDMLTLTTDARMDKVGHIMSDGNDGSGGGEVEAMFWVKDVSTQWRLNGRAFVVGGGRKDDRGSAERKGRDEIWKRMRPRPANEGTPSKSNDLAKSWSWEKEVTAHFANLSPVMRGSFRNPPPGTPRSAPIQDPSLAVGQKVHDLHDPVARSNFRVVVIQPEEVELVDLTDMVNGKRRKWELIFDDETESPGQWRWTEEELWP